MVGGLELGAKANLIRLFIADVRRRLEDRDDPCETSYQHVIVLVVFYTL